MIVPGFGPLDAKIVIVGEAPGSEEEQQGRPFIGSSGKLLRGLMSQVGISPDSCYFTNVVKTRPPNNDFGIYYEDTKKTSPSPMLRFAIAELHNELRGLRPNVIVPLGDEALRAITNKRGISSWRGSILSSPFGKVISTYHPAYILRSYAELPVFEHDLQRVLEESQYPEVKPLGHKLEINPSFQRCVEFMRDLIESPRAIAFDIESTRGTNHVRCLGIADSATHALCIPFMSFSRKPASQTTIFLGPISGDEVNSHWTESEEYEILRLLNEVFSNPTIPKYAQNFPFDSQVLGHEFGFTINGLALDTMVAAHNMYPEMPKSLDFLASLYTKVPYYSDYEPSDDLSTFRYCCFDCCVTYEIAEVLLKDLSSRRPLIGSPFTSLDFQQNHIQPAMLCMTRVGQRGVLIDKKVQADLLEDYSTKQHALEARLKLIIGSDINPGSPKQLQDLLYVKLGLPVQLHRKTKQPTVDENTLLHLSTRYPKHAEFFSVLLDWRELDKLVSTYLHVPLTPDGRIVTSYNVVGTVNGRCNSARTIWGLGTNLQNIPKRSALGRPLRRMFRADDGCVLIKADLSQAQWRAVVWLGRMTRLMEKYLNNPRFDVHKWVASLIYKVTEDSVTEDQRNIAKNGVYGGAFHMMPKTAAATYKIPLTEATFVLNSFWRELYELPVWWKDVERTVNTTRTLVSPLGRVRSFFGRLDDSLYREAYAFCPQAIEADIIHRAVILSELLLHDAFAVLQIHDELVISCKESALAETLPLVRNIMEYPIYFPGIKEPLLIPSDVSYGPNWLDQVKYKV